MLTLDRPALSAAPSVEGVFDRCGLAALTDLQTEEWQELFRLLEHDQEAFLTREAEFRSPAYKWPRAALHHWSRVWEYPYVYHHVRKWKDSGPSAGMPRVVDVGSGVTFFPFSLARLGAHVTCTDIDPVCEHDLGRAIRCTPAGPGKVDFRLIQGADLPFADAEADLVCCVSVLEHIPGFEAVVKEMARVLRPGGLFVLTIDIDLLGNSEIGVQRRQALLAVLRRHFRPVVPDQTIHPADLLHSGAGPCPERTSPLRRVLRFLLYPLLRPLGRGRGRRLAVEGFVLTRV